MIIQGHLPTQVVLYFVLDKGTRVLGIRLGLFHEAKLNMDF